ncbi:methylmalonyl Co-A mutase-associated GTPase MeaB [Anaerospora hongkongensis]|uniref:methylmalonyl Co-A mutase-associated GTPase MeaB n=1 Tax=Anaerospora hongkongensis TaxID=244830 RepID=UPI0028966673|nr:methylmalonyl Co-A mutase-associated GTPase MeaB [Anaerospora hongkongensis]
MSEKKSDWKPEWIPPEGGDAFATRVMGGISGGHDGMPGQGTMTSQPRIAPGRRQLTVEEYVQGIINGDRVILSRAITLIESNLPAHMDTAQQILMQLLPYSGKSIRVGITGVPGAGKSTFIEALGCRLCDEGHKVAVLAVDPSSTVTKGSILGDKTRMEELSRNPRAFIRPSPSSGTLGGVTRKSRETMLICEAAGYDVLLIETVGVGQSEVTVRSMVDFFLLLMITGAGDDLQGMKKGVVELADAIVINKADGDNKQRAMMAKVDYDRILHYLRPATEGWVTKSHTCSAYTGEGIPELWNVITKFRQVTGEAGIFERRRRTQMLSWVQSMVQEYLQSLFFTHPGIQQNRSAIEQAVTEGKLSATMAVKELIGIFEKR